MLVVLLGVHLVVVVAFKRWSGGEQQYTAVKKRVCPQSISSSKGRISSKVFAGKGFGVGLSKPKVIKPTPGNANNEKFVMMYTCNVCKGRNSQMVSKIAYAKGMVISRCHHCESKHLIADNENKLDMSEFGPTIDSYLSKQGENVTKIQIAGEVLQSHLLVEQDGQLYLYPKKYAASLSNDMTVIDVPIPKHKSVSEQKDIDTKGTPRSNDAPLFEAHDNDQSAILEAQSDEENFSDSAIDINESNDDV